MGEIKVHCVCKGDYFNCSCSPFPLPIIYDLDDYMDFLAYINMPRPHSDQLSFHRLYTQVWTVFVIKQSFYIVWILTSIRTTSYYGKNPLADVSLRRIAWN